jgi:cell division protein FtsQ
MALSDNVAPWEDEMPWTDLGQATPQPYRSALSGGSPAQTPAPARVPEPSQAAARAAQERVAQERAAQEKFAQEKLAQEKAAQHKAAQALAAREQAARADAEREQRKAKPRRVPASAAAASAAAATAGSADAVPQAAAAPRFEPIRRASPPPVAESQPRDPARAGRGKVAANPVDQALAQALDLRIMQLASRLLVGLALLALLGWGLVWLASGPWFAFKSLTVLGQGEHNSLETLRSEVLSKLHGGYFTLDLQEARQQFESLPWVRKAQVKRVWPDRLVVTLDEHQPRAVWEHEDEEDQLVDLQGDVFDGSTADLDDRVAQALPVLRGPVGSARQMLAMHQRMTTVFAGLQAELIRLELSERGSWRATLANRSIIELGRGEPDEVEQRTRRFVATVAEISARFGHRAVESADLRHQDGYALKLVGMGTAARPAGMGKGR